MSSASTSSSSSSSASARDTSHLAKLSLPNICFSSSHRKEAFWIARYTQARSFHSSPTLNSEHNLFITKRHQPWNYDVMGMVSVKSIRCHGYDI